VVTGPDFGADAAAALTDTSIIAVGQAALALAGVAVGTTHSLSAYLRAVDLQNLFGASVSTVSIGGGPSFNVPPSQPDWTRFDAAAVNTLAGPTALLQPDSSAAASLGSAKFDWIQYEPGTYPTSPILTTGAAVTRLVDTLTMPDPTQILTNGRWSIDMHWRPHYSDTEMTVDHNLVFFSATHRLFLRQADKKLVLRIGAADITSAALTWSRHQQLHVQAESTVFQRFLIVDGATTGNGVTLAGTAAATPSPAVVGIMGDPATGSEEASDLQCFSIFDPRLVVT
jgi:hypothetical protein